MGNRLPFVSKKKRLSSLSQVEHHNLVHHYRRSHRPQYRMHHEKAIETNNRLCKLFPQESRAQSVGSAHQQYQEPIFCNRINFGHLKSAAIKIMLRREWMRNKILQAYITTYTV
jgi:hypothetical protein